MTQKVSMFILFARDEVCLSRLYFWSLEFRTLFGVWCLEFGYSPRLYY
jgi:hypothetical protein